MQTNIDAYGLCVQPERCSIADISTTGQNETKNHDLSCFVSDCRSMAGMGWELRKAWGQSSLTTYCSEWNIFPILTNRIIQFPSIAVRDNKASKCECKCSSTWCIIAQLIACLLQNCCGALVQYLRACPGGAILPSSPSLPHSSVLYLPSCSLCLCTETESSSLITIIWMRDGVIISQVPSLRPHHNWKEGGAVLPWRPHQIGQSKTSQAQKLWVFFIVFFSPSVTVLIVVVGREVAGGEGE